MEKRHLQHRGLSKPLLLLWSIFHTHGHNSYHLITSLPTSCLHTSLWHQAFCHLCLCWGWFWFCKVKWLTQAQGQELLVDARQSPLHPHCCHHMQPPFRCKPVTIGQSAGLWVCAHLQHCWVLITLHGCETKCSTSFQLSAGNSHPDSPVQNEALYSAPALQIS